ncbi:elongation factor-like GTPase 1 [Saccostrea echinata]|uniref:elongation factor-like GTPase 1 n=1 Tax=Saccostrea echinata TaxID=191078 RepID=UPI002A81494B|nr:elongation factor-like GTPase 1 [Saccostrea echinata]
MKGATPELLSLLQRKPENIRNICILAHVDHGKTTLADALVASNGIISQRMAGKLRYMDSREDEQLRGITMKSSAISLIYNYKNEEYLINLIDSPGHVDFSSEVSTAVRLCEGAVVVVDVVEGVCPQTHAVLRQAFLENIKPVLVLNKIDRLIVEMKMEPMEAFYHLQQILEQVNLVTNELFTVEAMEKSAVDVDGDNGDLSQMHDWTNLEDEENRNIYFSPDQGNVIFASAYDGWGFSIQDFAVLYASKLGINQEVLQRTLWGDFFLNTKTKRIMKGAQIKAKKPLFVQFVLDNLWSVYDSIFIRRDKEKTEKIVTSLGLKIPPRDMRHSDGRVQLQAVCSQWLPVSSAVLRVVVSKLPSPLALSEERVEKLMCSQMRKFDSLPAETQGLKQSFLNCSASEESPVIVFVSKMLPVDKKMLPQNKQRPLTEAEIAERRRKAKEKMAERAAARNQEQTTEAATQEGDTNEALNPLPEDDPENKEKETDFVFVAFARVFSGTIRKGQKLYVLGPKHDPALISKKIQSGEEIKEVNSIQELSHDDHVTCVTIKELFVFMGRELEGMDHIPAGNILGIGGLEDHILKSATVSSTLMCPAFCDLYFDAAPIVRVAIEPSHTRDMQNLVEGLRLLNQADPCVQVLVQETGEHVIITAGEVHLQRCVDDLRERYAKIDINVSSPIVPFRETIVPPPKTDMVNETISDQRQVIKKDTEDDEIIEPGLVEVNTINGRCTLRIRAVPLPENITQLLEENQNLIKTMSQISKAHGKGRGGLEVQQSVIDSIREFRCQLCKVFKTSGRIWRDAENQIWSFGPKRVGPNVLLNRVRGYDRANVWNCVEQKQWELKLRQYDNSIISGFQIATLAGPLCEEPLRGVCFIIEEWNYIRSSHSISLDEEVHKGEVTEINSCDNPTSVSQAETVSPIQSETDRDGSESETESSDSEIEPSQPRQKEGHSHMSGQLIYCVKEGCRKAFQTRPQRLMVAMYKCNIQATAEVLGKLCGVLGKRFGRVIEDTMMEGSQNFNIKAVLPVVESFGFAEDVRKKTSGLASPQLVFSHWEVLDVDPFWVPTTEEEYTHFGEKADSDNRARHYMNQVRKRKGLKVDEKIVEHAEKQRTLTKMK